MSSEPNGQAETIRSLGIEALEACLELDDAALGGFWNRQQWHTELAEARRPCLGLWLGSQLQALACSWLVVDELHITAIAVRPQQRRRGLGGRVLAALLLEGTAQGPPTPPWRWPPTTAPRRPSTPRPGLRPPGSVAPTTAMARML